MWTAASKAVRTAGGPGTRTGLALLTSCSWLLARHSNQSLLPPFQKPLDGGCGGRPDYPGDSVQGPTRRARQTLVPWGVYTTWARSLQSGLAVSLSPQTSKPTRVNRPGQCVFTPSCRKPPG